MHYRKALSLGCMKKWYITTYCLGRRHHCATIALLQFCLEVVLRSLGTISIEFKTKKSIVYLEIL